MAITNASRVVSRAGKAKNRKWGAKERFSCGHDAAARSLLPEKPQDGPRAGIRTFRSETFGMTKADRVAHDAQHLLNIGACDAVEDAVDQAIAAIEAAGSNVQREMNVIADYESWKKVRR